MLPCSCPFCAPLLLPPVCLPPRACFRESWKFFNLATRLCREVGLDAIISASAGGSSRGCWGAELPRPSLAVPLKLLPLLIVSTEFEVKRCLAFRRSLDSGCISPCCCSAALPLMGYDCKLVKLLLTPRLTGSPLLLLLLLLLLWLHRAVLSATWEDRMQGEGVRRGRGQVWGACGGIDGAGNASSTARLLRRMRDPGQEII
mmetsp:Transcript_4236/g.11437  ORF Transcript_4236/g.11437 Transcript_4236/m.11437 type:complete len:202 (-) Transcript_4236:4738-5343(-)